VVITVAGCGTAAVTSDDALDAALREALAEGSLRDAATVVAAATGVANAPSMRAPCVWPRRVGHERARLGQRAEWLCAWVLRAKGYGIVARRHASHRGSGAGEIDILARRGGVLAVVEVKARRSLDEAAHALRAVQRRRLVRAAGAVLVRRPDLAGLALRFDAMLVAPWRWPRHVMDAWRDER